MRTFSFGNKQRYGAFWLLFKDMQSQSVIGYTDYRVFLKDYIEAYKAKFPTFSYQSLANKAGFKSKSYLRDVITGRRNLSKNSIVKLNTVLKLEEKELVFFEYLVLFNQTNSNRQKSVYFEKLVEMGGTENTFYQIDQNQRSFYSQWYHNTVRELVTMIDFKEDYQFLGQCLRPPITKEKAQESVQLQLDLGMIEKTEQGYVQKDADITTGDDVISESIFQFHQQNLTIGMQALQEVPIHDREISCLIASVSESGYNTIRQEIRNFRKRLVYLLKSDKTPDRVCHVNFQLFPTSEVTR